MKKYFSEIYLPVREHTSLIGSGDPQPCSPTLGQVDWPGFS